MTFKNTHYTFYYNIRSKVAKLFLRLPFTVAVSFDTNQKQSVEIENTRNRAIVIVNSMKRFFPLFRPHNSGIWYLWLILGKGHGIFHQMHAHIAHCSFAKYILFAFLLILSNTKCLSWLGLDRLGFEMNFSECTKK